MSRHPIVHVVALLAAVLVLLLGVTSCASVRSGGEDMNMSDEDGGIDMNAVETDAGENAMATVEPPPPPPPPAPESGEDIVLTGTFVPRPASAARPGETAAMAGDNDDRTSGVGGFVKPPPWTVGKTYTLEFGVGRNDAGLAAVTHGRALTGRSRIWMAPTMRVTLDPHPDFDIKPQNPEQEIQQLSPDGTANWFWTVVPHRAGRFTLVARVQAVTLGSDGEPVRDAQGRVRGRFYPAQPVEVQVKVGGRDVVRNVINEGTTLGEMLGKMFKSWEGMLLALAALITAAGVVWAAIRKLRGKPVRPRIRRRKKEAA